MRFSISLLLTLFINCFCFSQDYHYWSEIYGTKASAVGGSAFAGLEDNSTVYYNPAGMSFVSNHAISVNATTFRFRIKDIENGLGNGLNYQNSQFLSTPQLISGLVNTKYKQIRLGYAFLTKDFYHDKYTTRHSKITNIIDSIPGDENIVSSFDYSNKIFEYWAGLAISWQFHKNMSFGLSYFIAFRDNEYDYNFVTRALPLEGVGQEIPRVDMFITYDAWNLKNIFKFSYNLNLPRFRFGATFTFPSFRMMGKVDVQREFSVINLPESVPTDLNFSARNEEIAFDQRLPPSVAWGFSFRIGKKKNWLHFAGEYFFPIKSYRVFDGGEELDYYPNNVSAETINTLFGGQNFVSMYESYRFVINSSIGYEHEFVKWNLMLGFRTDFNYNAMPNFEFRRIQVEASKWPLMHFSLGMSFKTKKEKRITVSFEYGLTPRRKFGQILNVTEPRADNWLMGDRRYEAYVSQHSVKLMLGIEVDFKKKTSEPNLEE